MVTIIIAIIIFEVKSVSDITKKKTTTTITSLKYQYVFKIALRKFFKTIYNLKTISYVMFINYYWIRRIIRYFIEISFSVMICSLSVFALTKHLQKLISNSMNIYKSKFHTQT